MYYRRITELRQNVGQPTIRGHLSIRTFIAPDKREELHPRVPNCDFPRCGQTGPLRCLSRSQDVEDPELCGRPARRRRVHAEHVLEGAEPRPRPARVRPLQPPPHSQQGADDVTPPSSFCNQFNLDATYECLFLTLQRFPWGDGTKTLFHNPHLNALPDGYEGHDE